MNIDFVIPSYHSETLTTLAIKSFEKYKNDFNFRYIVVENGNDDSYKDNILSLGDNIVWVTNDCQYSPLQKSGGSYANAEAVDLGLEYVETEYVFVCHNDVVATHPDWMKFLYSKLDDECVLSAVLADNARINAAHISGILIRSDVAKQNSVWPVRNEDRVIILDVGDNWTKYCRDEGLNYYCCKNTHNNNVEEVPEPFTDFQVDRSVDDNGNVIFLHLGRGIEKLFGRYNKPNKTYADQWTDFVTKNVLKE